MKVLLVLSNFPDKDGEAIEVVGYEVMRLMQAAEHQVDVQVLIRESPNEVHAWKQNKIIIEASDLQSISMLPTIYLGTEESRGGAIQRKLQFLIMVLRSLPLLRRWPNPAIFPAIRVRDRFQNLIRQRKPDIVLSIWSWEALAATYAVSGVPKFVYYGNPDHKPVEARLKQPALFDLPLNGIKNVIHFFIMRMVNKAREVQHINMMKKCEVTANNSLVDAEYYRRSGHRKSLYIHNMWPQAKTTALFGGECNRTKSVKIVGSVGNLGATGNTFGLFFLGQRLAPLLERRFDKNGIHIDVFGGGKPSKVVAGALNRPSIRLRGWVQDINAEIKDSCAFLVLTNVSGFIVGNTRILLAWSLGACVIAHSNSALSMPEIKHMENALLGDDADEIAELIERVSVDKQLRETIGRGGYETFQKYYRSDIVVPQMLEEMEKCSRRYRGKQILN